ncbi:MAG: amino acid ABC transporter substrate-binding protein [Thermodesulfobacteriota bacterium]|nr:amino acid ABC transporter substrate-binding protein [Thermodesulfobacteriota bacterium]
MMKKFLLLVIGVFLIIFCLNGGALAKDNIRIGFSMALTGPFAPAAKGQMDAYLLWEELVNKNGGILVKEFGRRLPVKLVYYDDKSEAETAVKVYEKLITDDKVDLLFAPNSTTIHFAVFPIAEKYKAPIVGNTAASVKLRDLKSKYFWFVTATMADRQMRALVDLLISLKVKTVAVVNIQDIFPRENLEFLIPYLKGGGFEIVLQKDYPRGIRDMVTVLSEAKGKNPDAFIALSTPPDTFLTAAQIQEVGFNPKFFFQLIGAAAVAFGPRLGAATEGISTFGHWSPKAPWPGAKAFLDNYVAKFKVIPDYLNSTLAYVSCQIIEQAVERAGTLNWEKLSEVIAKEEFPTINGPIRFTGSENLQTPAMVLQWQKGEIEIIWPSEVATAKPLYPKPPWPKK